MSPKIGRNDPCPCGSGKKYKHCHGGSAASASGGGDSHSGAAQRALAWLSQRHRKAMKALFEELLFEDLWPEDGPDPEDVGEDDWAVMLVNLNEWILADGEIEVAGRWHGVNEYLLGDRGPALSPLQRDYLRQLAANPLKLYTVTEVRRGHGLTLVDAMDAESAPSFVQERSGSEAARAGMLIGCRIMRIADHLELSGAIYPFSMLGETDVRAAVHEAMEATPHPEDRAYEVALAILREWLRQFVMPPRMPTLVDASTGDPLLFVTDHYRIIDSARLVDVLDACTELCTQDGGWSREEPGADGIVRSRADIRVAKEADRLEVVYRTQRLADDGRRWFEALAGDCVRHLTRELVDPAGVAARDRAEGVAREPASSGRPDLPPEVLSQAIEDALRRSYANWADEPIPALAGKTPRQAMRTAAGLERVKGLLRSYEANESEMAERDGRTAISWRFLWDSLGLAYEE